MTSQKQTVQAIPSKKKPQERERKREREEEKGERKRKRDGKEKKKEKGKEEEKLKKKEKEKKEEKEKEEEKIEKAIQEMYRPLWTHSGTIVFSKIDLRGDFHQIKIRLGDGWKTIFRTRDDHRKLQQRKYGLYQIIKKINNNAYVVDLPNWRWISKIFNVVDLTFFQPYMSLGCLEVTRGRVFCK